MQESNNIVIIDAGDASGSISSDVVELFGPYVLLIEFEGSPVGTLDLQCSLDGEVFASCGDQDINGARSWIYNTPDSIYKFIKLVWTPDMGSTGEVSIRCRTFTVY